MRSQRFLIGLVVVAVAGLVAALSLWGGGPEREVAAFEVVPGSGVAPEGASVVVPVPEGAEPHGPPSSPLAAASIPDLVNLQGRLTDGAGNPVADGSHSVTFRVYDALAGGTLKWEESQSVSTAGGLFNVLLGAGACTVGCPLSRTAFDGSPRYLELQVSPDPAMAPRQQFVTVPYAFFAEVAHDLQSLRVEDNATSPNLIGGRQSNSATSGVLGATIGGGGNVVVGTNRVTDDYGTVSGGAGNRAGDDAGTTADRPYGTVGGGALNIASGSTATVGGGSTNAASAENATVGGGFSNTASVIYATVGGGALNTASGTSATVSGGASNLVSGAQATVGGGASNIASGLNATVGGGFTNTASNSAATVGGGSGNTASGMWSTVSGGISNTASGFRAAVGGGESNVANASHATVGGGFVNTAGGGQYSTVGGGVGNTASGETATVGGGNANTASNTAATVPGGYLNTASGFFSFAAGRQAKATHNGTFVWGDFNSFDFASAAVNEFAVRATGGARFVSAIDGTGAATAGVSLAAGGTSWSAISDRSLKENFQPVDRREILRHLAAVPIETWNAKSQDESIRHIGPTAQDFYRAFGLGEDDKHITTVDADGVALAAIQGLYEIVQEMDVQFTTLREEKDRQIAILEKRVDDMERGGGDAAVASRVTGASGLPALWLVLGGLVVVLLSIVGGALGSAALRRAGRQ